MQRFLKIAIIVAGVAVLAIGAGAWWWHARSSSQLSYRTALVKRGDVAATISASGTIEPVEVVDVGAQVAGLIKSFGTDISGRTIDYGSVVDEGAVLAKIDDSVYAADLSVARRGRIECRCKCGADEGQARSGRGGMETRTGFIRQQIGRRKWITTRTRLITKSPRPMSPSPMRDVAQAQASLEKAQRNLDFCVIKSPVKGVIIDRRVNIGQTVVSSLNAPSLFLIAQGSDQDADLGGGERGGRGPHQARCARDLHLCDAFPGREFRAPSARCASTRR